jgi:hypothetical protein
MPFVLRRTKQQVLKDLPPKIITDVYCDLTPLQRQLYEDFASTPAAASAAGALRSAAADGGGEGGGGSGGGGGTATHVFQALAYLRKLCSHPLLALDWTVPEHRAAALERLGARSAAEAEAALSRAEAAPKLLALRDLLVQCGLVAGGDGGGGEAAGGGGGSEEDAADGGHRLLVFAQLKSTLDFVESQLLAPLGVRRRRSEPGQGPGSCAGAPGRPSSPHPVIAPPPKAQPSSPPPRARPPDQLPAPRRLGRRQRALRRRAALQRGPHHPGGPGACVRPMRHRRTAAAMSLWHAHCHASAGANPPPPPRLPPAPRCCC